VPKKAKSSKRRAFYKSPPPKRASGILPEVPSSQTRSIPQRASGILPEVPSSKTKSVLPAGRRQHVADLPHAHPVAIAPFTLREDGSIGAPNSDSARSTSSERASGILPEGPSSKSVRPASETHGSTLPRLIFSSDTPFVRLYHGNSLELLDAIAAKYPAGRFDAIFADPPYFLSNGGITCHAGKMVKVDKGDWDVSRGPELNHEFNVEWLRRCQRVLKPNGTIWVTGTHHVIFSIGYALQQLGFKILNDIAWEKPNPPPNLSCRYFTHSTETVLWAAKNGKSKHVFNYQTMRKVTGKQMKTVWRAKEWSTGELEQWSDEKSSESAAFPSNTPTLHHSTTPFASNADPSLESIWTLGAPGRDEKELGKHPTQKPVALVEHCLLASTNEGDLVLDPFLGNGTTAVASLRLKRGCVGVELDLHHVEIAARRADREIIEIWLRHFRVRIDVSVVGRAELPLRQASCLTPCASLQIDLAIFPDSINGSRDMADVPEIQTERIFHECKFVFLSCAQVERGAVVHTTVDVSLQEAWAKTPTGKKRETTHVVRCETEIFRVADRK
jgi:site-specific DNA-methyltransferase (adenine-specific)